MAKITMTLENQDKVQVKLDVYDREMINDLKKIIKNNSAQVVRVAKAKAPVRTGNLKSSIRSKDVSRQINAEPGLAKTVTARGRKGGYRHLIELGTAERYTKSRAHRGRIIARPFLAPAEAETSPKYQAEIRKRVLKKEVI